MESQADTDIRIPKKRGPAKRLDTDRYQVMLDPTDAEWAKSQPGGLSELVRRLLREEKQRQDDQK